jgi:HAD superfamily hydrolase (TIGR01509 family)
VENAQLQFVSQKFNLGILDRIWKSKAKAFIFDLDGVIIDSLPNYCYAWRESFKQYDIYITADEVYLREGEKKDEMVRNIYIKYKNHEPNSCMIKRIIENEEEIYQNLPIPKATPCIYEFLRDLDMKKVKLAMVTGSSRQTVDRFRLPLKQIFNNFSIIVTGDDTTKGKPNPDPYLTAVRLLDMPSDNCCAIENSPLGIKSALNAKLACVAIKGSSPLSENLLKSAGAHYIFKDINELREYIVYLDKDEFNSNPTGGQTK